MRHHERTAVRGEGTAKAILTNTGWLFFERGFRAALGLLVGAWVARYLGPEQFGALAYAIAFAAFFQTVANLGLDGVVIRDIVRDPGRATALLGTAIHLRLATSGICWLFACALALFVHAGDIQSLTLIVLVVSGLFFQTSDVLTLWFQSQSQNRRSVLARVSGYVLANAAKVVLILSKASLFYFGAAALLEAVLCACFLRLSYSHFRTAGLWKWDTAVARDLLTESWALLLSGLAIIVYMRIDQVMLRGLVGDRELGLYSVVMPLSEIWNLVPVTVCAGVAPLLARLRASDVAAYYGVLQKLFTVLAAFAVVIAVVVSLSANQIVSWLFGAAYAGSAQVLAIHVFAVIPASLGVVQSQWIVNEGASRLSLYKTLAGAACNIGLNFILIPTHGATGAAFATLVSYSVSGVLCNVVLAPRIFVMQLRAFMLKYS